ncbi:hypothetical protein [Lactobacillus johnsonii]|uniref:Gram-positive cocci surface proteins LPxTG domain-containing protein n=1 Tax=Lactobacillus johnsonii TaxID=33959 RepID=A0A9X0LY46_LACJH|nr:hypothetical protein [Lactobacillus johnsonii]KXN76638.1 hypothetical protein AYJ53_02295 [Lactobacillus johnsonii]
MKKRTTMLMSALFAAGAFALNGNVAKADNVQVVNNNNANSTEVKQNTVNTDSSKLNVASAQASNQADTKIPSKEQLKDTAMKQYNEAKETWKSGADQSAYDVAVWDAYSRGGNVLRYGGRESIKKSQIKNYDWSSVNSKVNTAKEKFNTYLDKAVENDTSAIESSKKAADGAFNNIILPEPDQSEAQPGSSDYNLLDENPNMQKVTNNLAALGEMWNTIQYPYLATLIGSRTALENSDYKNEEGFYSDKLAELVARNVRKDKNWVLANTNPKTIRFGMPGGSPEIKDAGGGIGESSDDRESRVVKYDTVLPYFIYNKELIKVDRDAYNRNNDIKSDETTSDNKNQSTTDAKKDQSSEKVTNDTTSKKDQSTTSTSSSNTNQTTESKSSTISSKTASDTKTPVAKNEGSNTKTTDVVKSENKTAENTASVVKNDTKAATEKTTDVKVVAPAKNASNEVKTTDVAAKASDAHVVALNSKVNAGTTSTTPAAAKGSQAKATENKLPQAGTDEKISLFASLAGLSIASLGLGALGVSKKRKND